MSATDIDIKAAYCIEKVLAIVSQKVLVSSTGLSLAPHDENWRLAIFAALSAAFSCEYICIHSFIYSFVSHMYLCTCVNPNALIQILIRMPAIARKICRRLSVCQGN